MEVRLDTEPNVIDYTSQVGKFKLTGVSDSVVELQTEDLTVSDDLSVTGTVTKTSANGATHNIKTITGTHTCDSGTATETLTGVIPAGVTVLGVSGKVTTVLAGTSLTTWSAGETGDLNLWGDTLAKTAGTEFKYSTATANPQGTWTAAARDLIFTAAAGQFDSGVISYCIFYTDNSAPTS